MSLNIGDKIPEFELYNHDKTKRNDKDFLVHKTMFVFMPFPFSSVCDKEICELRDYQESFIKENKFPIAVRSSSLLEDSQYQPLAGTYETIMLSNNSKSNKTRLNELIEAIKIIYASTFKGEARALLKNTAHRIEEEKMAVIIMELIFGYWFEKYNFGPYMREHRMKNQMMEYELNGVKETYYYRRNYYGFRGKDIMPSDTQAIFLGPSTIDQVMLAISLARRPAFTESRNINLFLTG